MTFVQVLLFFSASIGLFLATRDHLGLGRKKKVYIKRDNRGGEYPMYGMYAMYNQMYGDNNGGDCGSE